MLCNSWYMSLPDLPTIFFNLIFKFYSAEDEPQVKTLFPNSSLKFIEGAGHWVHADKPNEFIKEVVNFINEDPS